MSPEADFTIQVERTPFDVNIRFFIEGGYCGALTITPDQWDNVGSYVERDGRHLMSLLLEAVEPARFVDGKEIKP